MGDLLLIVKRQRGEWWPNPEMTKQSWLLQFVNDAGTGELANRIQAFGLDISCETCWSCRDQKNRDADGFPNHV